MKSTAPRPTHKPLKGYEPGYLHVEVKYLPQMAEEVWRRYLFVAIDRATRWDFIRAFPAKTAATARRLPHAILPCFTDEVLTDNGNGFALRPAPPRRHR